MGILGFVSRRPFVTLGVAAAVWWSWPSSSSAPAPAAVPVQAAVLADGFAAIDGANRITELDSEATRRRDYPVRGAGAEARVVGIANRIAVVWRDGKRVLVGMVGSGGEVGQPTQFGRRVTAMCDGVASNDHRFGVAWREADGSVWVVFGPTAAQAVPDAQLAAKSDFCAVATVEDKLALLWTEGSRTSLTICDKKCAAQRRVELPKHAGVVGYGCTRRGCLVATRTTGGALQGTWIDLRGKQQWTKPLPHAAPDTPVVLAGTDTQVAIAYATANEPVVVTASPTGTLATVWQGAADGVPGLVHSDGRLLVARRTGGEIVGSLVRAP